MSADATLYVGLDPTHFKTDNLIVHCPLIQTFPRDFNEVSIKKQFDAIPKYTHLIFTSKIGVKTFLACLAHHGYTLEDLAGKKVVAVGKKTAATLEKEGIKVTLIADEETQEGVVKKLELLNLDEAYLFLLQSALARSVLTEFLTRRGVNHQLCPLYDTKTRIPKELPKLENYQEIVFTSPSTVNAFIELFGSLPQDKKLTPIGPVTRARLEKN